MRRGLHVRRDPRWLRAATGARSRVATVATSAYEHSLRAGDIAHRTHLGASPEVCFCSTKLFLYHLLIASGYETENRIKSE